MAFKIGDTVICKDASHRPDTIGYLVKGKEYVIDGFSCCGKCGTPTLFLVGLDLQSNSHCKCGGIVTERQNYRASRFEKPIMSSSTRTALNKSLEEYKNISLQELTEMEEMKN